MTNPGFLLVSLNQYYEGGISECRNPSLQKMFGTLGKTDKAGSGVDKILKGWRSAKWRRPYIEERSLPDKVELYLPMESLISEENLRALHEKFGDSVYKLDYNRLSILSSAYLEEYVTNNSLRNQIELHPADITKLLRELVKENFLLPSGFGRGTRCYLSKLGCTKLGCTKLKIYQPRRRDYGIGILLPMEKCIRNSTSNRT